MLSHLLALLVMVESSGLPHPPDGDGGRAVGVLQTHEAVVADVNRVYGTRYTLEDRRDPVKSHEMARLYLTHWGQRYQRLTGKAPSAEVYARLWNGGPDGYKKKATDPYWRKAQKAGAR